MFPITITINTLDQFNAVQAALSIKRPAQDKVEQTGPKEQTTTAKTDKAPAHTQPTAEAVVDAVPEKKADDSKPSETTKEVTKEDAKRVALALAKNKSRDALIEVLGKFGAANLDGVKPDDYAAFVQAATEAGA